MRLNTRTNGSRLLLLVSIGMAAGCLAGAGSDVETSDVAIGRVEISTVPFPPHLRMRSATYTPSGKVLVTYYQGGSRDPREIHLAVMNDDGTDLRPFFSGRIPDREQDNGLRYMVFADGRRIFLGDFVLECATSLGTCGEPTLLPVDYPAAVAGGDAVAHRWSEMIVAPDGKHVAWTTLFANGAAAVLTGRLERGATRYAIVSARVVSAIDPFRPDPEHADGVLPSSVRNGEVKQFVRGGRAISLVGAKRRDTADSVVLDLATGEVEQITDAPGYDETTIFSPDERLGIVMSSRFSPSTDLGILGWLPRPHPVSLNMGLSMHSYVYSVVGVRSARPGNVGPVLIDIQASKSQAGYRGIDLHEDEEWVYGSPMSWHPGGRKAMWMEGLRGSNRLDGKRRIRVVHLPDYAPGPPIPPSPTPSDLPYAEADLSALGAFASRPRSVDIRVYGRHSGHIAYRRSPTGTVEKTYIDFSDDGEHVYDGSERMQIDRTGESVYTADVTLSGTRPGRMDLQITFGSLRATPPARIVFAPDETGRARTRGFVEYDGERLEVEGLVP